MIGVEERKGNIPDGRDERKGRGGHEPKGGNWAEWVLGNGRSGRGGSATIERKM